MTSSQLGVDTWKKKQWDEIIRSEKFDVIVATAQIILDGLVHGFLRVSLSWIAAKRVPSLTPCLADGRPGIDVLRRVPPRQVRSLLRWVSSMRIY